MKRLLQLAILTCCVCTVRAQGTLEAFGSSAAPGSGQFFTTAGWTFTPQTVITISDLGCLSEIIPSGSFVQVGLWSDQGLMGQASIYETNTLVNASRYSSIAPIALEANQTYRIGVYSSLGLLLSFLDNPTAQDHATMGVGIQLGSMAESAGNSFAIPQPYGLSGSLILGPNFLYQQVPEPSTLALLSLGGVALLVRRKSRV